MPNPICDINEGTECYTCQLKPRQKDAVDCVRCFTRHCHYCLFVNNFFEEKHFLPFYGRRLINRCFICFTHKEETSIVNNMYPDNKDMECSHCHSKVKVYADGNNHCVPCFRRYDFINGDTTFGIEGEV